MRNMVVVKLLTVDNNFENMTNNSICKNKELMCDSVII